MSATDSSLTSAAGVPIVVRVKPGSSRNRVGGSYGQPVQLIVAVTAPAVDGRANDAVLAAVAEAFGLRASAVVLRGGATSRTKKLHLSGDVEGITQRLASLLAL